MIRRFVLTTTALSVALSAVLVGYYCRRRGPRVFSREELAKYKSVPYVAIMGKVFDCSEGKKHYQKGSYDFFAGTDGSLAFVTGDFELNVTDNVTTLDQTELFELQKWVNQTYYTKYIFKGFLNGYFYEDAKPTIDHLRVLSLINKEYNDKPKREADEKLYSKCAMKSSKKKGEPTYKSATCPESTFPRSRAVHGGKPRCACLPLDLLLSAPDDDSDPANRPWHSSCSSSSSLLKNSTCQYVLSS